MPSIQVAFQGGGAKLIDMLPIAAAFQHCHRNEKINISALSGTSAGAICAALIATNCNFDALREFLKTRGPAEIAKIIPPQIEDLKQLRNSGWLKRSHLLYKNAGYLKDIVFAGRAAFKEDAFKQFIEKLLSYGDKDMKTVESVERNHMKLFITTSNIAESESYVHEKGLIADAVVDSCSIPFAFRSFSSLSATHLVDGGLCDNLPIDCLVKHSKAPVFAVFPEDRNDREEVNHILGYVLRLFSASINHSVKRSKERISQAFSIPVQSELSTFDFRGAIEKVRNDDWFDTNMRNQVQKIEDFANSYGNDLEGHYYRFVDVNDNDDYIESLEELTQNYCDMFEYKTGRFEVRVRSDQIIYDDNAKNHRPADTQIKTARLRVINPNFRYCRSALSIDPITNEALPTIWGARNLTRGVPIPIKVLALRKPAGSTKVGMACLIVFMEHMKHISVGDIIEIKDITYIRDGMKNLNKRTTDFFGMENPHERVVETAELILHYPSKLGTIELFNDRKRGNLQDADVTKMAFPEPDDFEDRLNIVRVGLTCQNVQKGQRFYCLAVPQRN